MKTIRKIFLFVFVFVLAIVVFSFNNTKVKADPLTTSNKLVVEGAAMRTIGNAGIRFAASVGDYNTTNVTAYGIAIAYGNVSVSDDFKVGGTIGGKVVLSNTVDELDNEGKFYIVLWNIPEASYIQDVTARAFVIDNGNYVYGTTVTVRNLAQVAIAAKNDGFNGGLIDIVVNDIENNYKYVTTTTTNEVVVSDVYTLDYSYSNLENLWSEFISDYNAATGETLTTDVTARDFFNSFSTGISANSVKILPTNCNAVKMFSETRMVKWGWILQYLKEHYKAIHIKNQADALLREDRTCVTEYNSTVLQGYKLQHLSASIWNFFNEGAETLDYDANSFNNGESSYSLVEWPIFDNDRAKRVDNTITLPLTAQNHAGYSLTGFSDSNDTYSLGGNYTLTSSNNIFKPTYAAIDYSITYYDNSVPVDLSPSSYNIETPTFSLPILEDTVDYLFCGWYDNAGLEGDSISSITLGSYGNKTFYASWTENVPTPVVLTSYQTTLINTYHPNKFVSNDFIGGKFIINDVTYNASTGEGAYKTIGAALAASAPNDVIFVFPGTYAEDLSISGSGIKLIGNNADIDGNDTRNAESTITGVITITGANVQVNGFANGNTGRYSLRANNIKLSCLLSTYNGVRNTDYIMLESSQSGTIVEKVKATLTSTSRFVAANDGAYTITSPTVRGCYVVGHNREGSADSYVDGIKFNNITGTVTISNNHLDGFDQYPIFLGSSANTADRISILGNTFTRGGNAQEVISIRASKATTITEVIGNSFTNTRGTYVINIRGTITDGKSTIMYNVFNDAISSKLTKYLTSGGVSEAFDVSYNYFNTMPSDITVQTSKTITNSLNNSVDAAHYYELYANATYGDIDYQLDDGVLPGGYITNYRLGINTSIPIPTKEDYTFIGWTLDELSTDYITYIPYSLTGNITLYAHWNDNVAYIGLTGYKTIQAAIDAATENDVINVEAGCYNGNITLNKSNITLVGPNYNIDPNTGVRVGEAILTGTITIGKNCNNISINGFSFINDAQILNERYESAADSKTYANTDFAFNYNIVNKGISTNAFMLIENPDKYYHKNISISNNYFTASSLSASATNLVHFTNNENTSLNNNVFENIPYNCFRIDKTTNGAGEAGSFQADYNKFFNIYGSAIWVDWFSPVSASCTVEVGYNIFDRVDGGACVDFENSNADIIYASASIHHNIFKDVWKCYWGPKFKASEFVENVILQDDLTTGQTSAGYVAKTYASTDKCQMNNNLFLDKTGTNIVSVATSWYNAQVICGDQYATISAYKTANQSMNLTGYVN